MNSFNSLNNILFNINKKTISFKKKKTFKKNQVIITSNSSKLFLNISKNPPIFIENPFIFYLAYSISISGI